RRIRDRSGRRSGPHTGAGAIGVCPGEDLLLPPRRLVQPVNYSPRDFKKLGERGIAGQAAMAVAESAIQAPPPFPEGIRNAAGGHRGPFAIALMMGVCSLQDLLIGQVRKLDAARGRLVMKATLLAGRRGR